MSDLLSINAEKVLKILRKKKGKFLTTQQIASSSGLSRFNIYRSIHQLQNWGYQIESQKGRGYCLKRITDLLLPFEVRNNLKTRILGREIHSYQTLKSTNLLAYKLAEAGSVEGTIVISEKQTAGKGRMGRSWSSPAKVGLWMSLILRPSIPPPKTPGLSICAGLALAQTVQGLFGLKAKIKWPNDCLIDQKKVAGILLELSAEMDQIKFVIMGMGININQRKSDFPKTLQSKATSIRIELGDRVSRIEFLRAFLERFEKIYYIFVKKGLKAFGQEIRKYSSVLNQEVKIKFAGQIITGKALNIDDNGSLIVKTKQGIRSVVAGEVSLL